MSDEELIAEVARVWVAGGGDAEGIVWCWRRIQEAVQRLQDEEKK